MYIDLTDLQAQELVRALGLHLYRLQEELVRTEDRDYQHTLRVSMAVLEEVQRKLEVREALAGEYA